MHVADEKGEKMSKSLGNVIDPQEVLGRYGAEAFRIWACLEGDIARGDIRCSFQRIEGHSKFLTKLWNIARFISSFPLVDAEPQATDRWILAELSRLISDVTSGYDKYTFHGVATRIRDFAWNLFADHYVEMAKPRAYGTGFSKEEQEAAWCTLNTCMKTILLLLAPIIPFITDHLWRQLYGDKSVHIERLPEAKWNVEACKGTETLTSFNSMVWNTKKERRLSLRDSIKVEIPKSLEPYLTDLKAMHRIE